MPAKKVSHLLHLRINELLDQIILRESAEKNLNNSPPESESPQLNLGDSMQPLSVSMESFFEFNFELSDEIDQWMDEQLEESRLDAHFREWNPMFGPDEFNRNPDWEQDQVTSNNLPKRPK